VRPRRPPARRPAAPKPAARPPQAKGSLFGLTVVFLVLGIVVITALILLGGIVGNPDLATPVPGTFASVTPEPTFQELGSQWVVTFEYAFANRDWSLGQHEYVLDASCPSLPRLSGTFPAAFPVIETAPRYPLTIYLRTRGVSDSRLDGDDVPAVHPNQALAAAYSLIFPTLEQARSAMSTCRVTVSLDRGTTQTLVAFPPYEP